MSLGDPRYLWINQYANESNWRAHYEHTAREVANAFPHVDFLFIGAGTTGTLMGCARYFRDHHPATQVIAVDTIGSVTFGGAPGRRHIPASEPVGSLKSAIRRSSTKSACRRGRDGGDVPPARKPRPCGRRLHRHRRSRRATTARRYRPQASVVALSPDMAEKYVKTIYSDEWVGKRFPVVQEKCASQGMEEVA